MTTWKEAFNAVREERRQARERKAQRDFREMKEFLRFYEDCRNEEKHLEEDTLMIERIAKPS